MKRLVVALLLLLAPLAHADFVTGNTPLPANKINLNPLPPGANPNLYFLASDYNNLAQAAVDLRSAITGRTTGYALTLGDGSGLAGCSTSSVGSIRYNQSLTRLEQCVNAAGTWSAIGGAATVTLAQAYSNGASISDSTMTVDSTRGAVRVFDAASPLNATIFSVNNNSGSAFFAVTDNSTITLKSGGASGGTAVQVDTFNTWTGGSLLRISSNGISRYSFQPFGAVITPIAQAGVPNILIITAAANPANTASTEVSDVDFNFARISTWSAGALTTQRFFRIRAPTVAFASASTLTNTATLWVDGGPKAGTNATLTNTAAAWIQTGADAVAGLYVQSNSTTQAGTLFATLDQSGSQLFQVVSQNTGLTHQLILNSSYNGGAAMMAWNNTTLGTSTQFNVGSGVQVLMGGNSWSFYDSNGNFNELQITLNGAASNRFGVITSQSKAFSATPAFDCTAGNFIHIGTITGNVTGPTMVAGKAGEVCTIVWLKDATAGTYTIGGWGSNVRFNGTATFTSTASSIITQTFRWDDILGTPAWVLQSQQPGL